MKKTTTTTANVYAIDSVWFVKVNFFLHFFIHQVNLNEVLGGHESGERKKKKKKKKKWREEKRRKKTGQNFRWKKMRLIKSCCERDCEMCALMKQSNWKIDDAKLNKINFDLCANKYRHTHSQLGGLNCLSLSPAFDGFFEATTFTSKSQNCLSLRKRYDNRFLRSHRNNLSNIFCAFFRVTVK